MSVRIDTTSQEALIHGPFQPASVFPGMGVRASLPVSDSEHELRFWRLSPHGVEFVWPEGLRCEAGQSLFLYLFLGSARIRYAGVIVVIETSADGQKRVGVAYETHTRPERPLNAQRESRLHARWDVDHRYYPAGVASSPINFHDSVMFTVADVSASGLRLLTSMRNKFLLPGLALQAKISFPPLGTIDVKLLLRNACVVEDNGEKMQSFGAQVLNRDDTFTQTVSAYVLRFGRSDAVVTPAILAQSSLETHPTLELVDWGFADKEGDEREIAQLNKHIGALAPKASCLFADVVQLPKKYLVGRLRGRIVVCLSLSFPTKRVGAGLGLGALQIKGVPIEPEKCVQISDLAAFSGFDTRKLTEDLVLFSFFVALQAGRQAAFFRASEEQADVYTRLGFQQGSIDVTTALGQSNQLRVKAVDILALLTGKGLKVKDWQRMFCTSTGHVPNQAWDGFLPRHNLRRKMYSLCARILDALCL